jgi:hypothetical protein
LRFHDLSYGPCVADPVMRAGNFYGVHPTRF